MYIFIFHFLSIFILTFTTHKVLKPSRRCCSGAVCFTEYLNINLHSTMYLFQQESRPKMHQYMLNLHSTMYLFQLPAERHITSAQPDLHSTMYLFQLVLLEIFVIHPIFTFHYVSISTTPKLGAIAVFRAFTFHYVSISTIFKICSGRITSAFTFHYVSISTSTVIL